MSQLISVRTNIFYTKVKGEYLRNQELIFLLDKPKYSFTNENEVLRERGIEEVRMMISQSAFEQMLEILTSLKDVKEEDLK